MQQADIILRINELFNDSKLTQEQFAQKLGIDQSNFSKILKGQRTCGKNIKKAICSSFNVIPNWLENGKGDKYLEQIPKGEGLPLLPYSAMAGALSGSSISTMDYECEHYVVPAFHNADFLVRVQGDSMMPRYCSGDIVACKKVPMNKLFFQWGKTYVLSTSQGVLIKRVDPGKREDTVSIVSYNKEYQTFQLPMEDINKEGLAMVVGLIRIE